MSVTRRTTRGITAAGAALAIVASTAGACNAKGTIRFAIEAGCMARRRVRRWLYLSAITDVQITWIEDRGMLSSWFAVSMTGTGQQMRCPLLRLATIVGASR